MQPETILISKIINGGFGLGHAPSGQVVLVRHVLPGETVLVTALEKKKNHLLARLDEVLTPHRQRRPPPCPYAGQCGGCDFQHGDYALQLQLKKAVVAELLLRGGPTLAAAAEALADPLGAPQELHYRQRLRLRVDGRVRLGFTRFQSHEVVPVAACLLGGALHNRVLSALATLPAARTLCQLAEEVEILENPDRGQAVVVLRLRRKPRPADISAARAVCGAVADIASVFLHGSGFALQGPYGAAASADGLVDGRTLAHSYAPSATLPRGLSLGWEVGGFCQVNLRQNLSLIDTVLDFCQPWQGMSLLDLYCGMGNFSLPLAMRGARVHGIEGQAAAIRSASANAMRAGLTETRFEQSPIHQACDRLVTEGRRFDCIVIDPPRQGAPELAPRLAELTAGRLVYISCDPATLCRDLQQLVAAGFAIRRLQPVDMFPQTHHIETVVLLEKAS